MIPRPFARLLLSDEYRDTCEFEHWKDMFPLLYNGSVEEVAEKEVELGGH
jgi:hypothetical protein